MQSFACTGAHGILPAFRSYPKTHPENSTGKEITDEIRISDGSLEEKSCSCSVNLRCNRLALLSKQPNLERIQLEHIQPVPDRVVA